MSKFPNRYFVVYLRNGLEETATVRSNCEDNAMEFVKQTTSGFGGIKSIKLIESGLID